MPNPAPLPDYKAAAVVAHESVHAVGPAHSGKYDFKYNPYVWYVLASRYGHIPIDQIKVPKNNVRLYEIDKGTEDLATSIRANGLIAPIVVYYDDDRSYYMALAGQRRFNAYHYLNQHYPDEGYDKIECKIIPEPDSDEKKSALSLAENITQIPLAEQDLTRAVTYLYKAHGGYETVQEKSGTTRRMVDRYVRLARLPEEIRAAISNGEISPNPVAAESMALKAVDAYEYANDGDVPVKDVVELAARMAKRENNAADIAREVVLGGTPDEIEKRARGRTKSRLQIDLYADTAEKLRRVADSSGETAGEKAVQYIATGVDEDYRDG